MPGVQNYVCMKEEALEITPLINSLDLIVGIKINPKFQRIKVAMNSVIIPIKSFKTNLQNILLLEMNSVPNFKELGW